MRRAALLLLLLLVALAALTWRQGLPLAWNPRAPLDLTATPNLLTGWKLRRLRHDPALCHAALASASPRMTPVRDQDGPGACGLTDAVRLHGIIDGAPVMSCPLAVAWLGFEAHGLQAAARTILGAPVKRVSQLGTYSCRPVRGGTTPSQHATADAIDLSAVTLGDGRRVTLAGWQDPGPQGRFLHAARDAACAWFGGVLSPDWNALHRDHLHLQAGGRGFCR